jgi:hypothetical protein
MTGRRFNYTGRRRITHDRVNAAILPGESGPELTAKVDLDSMGFDPSDRVVIEVYLQSVIERLELGTADAPRALVARPLQRFADVEGLRCRVKVIATQGSEAGLLRGIADKLRPDGDGQQSGQSLLPFVADPSLGQRVWKLDTSEDAPVVLVNPMGGLWRNIVREPVFAQLVLPEILDRIVRWVAANRLGDEDDGPVADWTTFFESLGADTEALVQSTPEEDIDVVVEDIVRRFTGNHAFADALLQVFMEEGE